ncbi:MAG: GEVED domain-containing protein, partial [Bacteroidota bacterium]
MSQAILQESFEGSFPPAGWTIFNNGNGNNWSQNTSATYSYDGTKSMQLMYNFSNAADAWAFTPALTLNTNPATITFYSRVRSASYPENLKLTVGTGNTVASQTTVLLDSAGLTNVTYQQFTATYTPTNAGTFYFAFNCYSDADQFYLYVDSVTISQLLPGCSGAPIGGTAVASTTGVCANAPFSLLVNGGSPIAAGLTYQWQTSSDNSNWSDISGETNSTTNISAGISSPTYYRRTITCGGSIAFSSSVLVNINPLPLCACSPDNGTTLHTSTDPTIYEVDIPGTKLTSVSGTAPSSGYTLYNDTAIIPNLTQGVTYTLNTTFSSAGIASVWFDWNQDGTFDPSEWTQITTNATNGSISFTVAPNALIGKTAMRIRLRAAGNPNGSGDACTQFGSGETEDYVINILAGTTCSGTPSGGTAVASVSSICSGNDVNFTVTGATSGSIGLSYQWQVSIDSGKNFTDVVGADSVSHYEAAMTSATCFRRSISCGSLKAYTNIVCLTMNPASLCPCSPANGTVLHLSTGPTIDEVDIPGTKLTNNSAGANTNGYSLYNDTSITPTLKKGDTYTLNTTFSAAAIASVWFDWNQDGTFDASEWTQITTSATNGAITFTVDPAAITGKILMRIRTRLTGNTNGSGDACTQFGSGETEDYLINIIGNNYTVQGNITYPNGKLIPSVDIKTTGSTISNTFTSGTYSLNIPTGNYTVRATKSNEIVKANGVTALDLALIQSHILGKNPLNSPYKIIAADVTGDGKVTALDLVYIKRLILDIDSVYPSKKLWVFVDSNFIFTNPLAPFPFKDSISYSNLSENKINQTLIGIKLGDV